MSLSPLDGRYYDQLNELRQFFSEKALIEKRIYVENKYLEFIISILQPTWNFELINPEPNFATNVKEIEKKTKHDVKAVEYYLQSLYSENHPEYIPYIHIGLTSEDVNCLAKSLLLKEYTALFQQHLTKLMLLINESSFWDIAMTAKTHGQLATPTNLGKEMYVYYDRLDRQMSYYDNIKHRTKFGGATGGFNALRFAYPDINWNEKLNQFISSFNLERHKYTTQIDHFDNYAEIFDWIKRINTILIDLCQDVWLYCSMDYFKLSINVNEVGSSTMPHKVNPIDFENAEGNLKLSNALLSFLSEKLPISRLQRDLTDSTVSRNIGVAFGHSYLAIHNLIRGWSKLKPNEWQIINDLNSNYIVLGEAIQTILRKNGVNDGYEIIKKHTRNNDVMTKDKYLDLINQLSNLISEDDKVSLLKLTPESYSECSIVGPADWWD